MFFSDLNENFHCLLSLVNGESNLEKALNAETRSVLATVQKIFGRMRGYRTDYVRDEWIKFVKDNKLELDGKKAASLDFQHQKVTNN